MRSVFGGARGDRTPDLYNAIVALSQLSYGPTRERPCYNGAIAYFNPPRLSSSCAWSALIS